MAMRVEDNTAGSDEIRDIADKLFKMKEAAQADLKALNEYLNEQPSSTPWFFNTITALLRALGREYRYLNIGYAKDGRLLAWACRNLLEINLYSVLAVQEESEQLMLKPYLYRAGTLYFVAAYKFVRDHIEKLGTAPPSV